MNQHFDIDAPVIDAPGEEPAAPFSPRFPDVVDSTMLAAYDACATKFHNEHVQCLSGIAVSPDLHAGGAIARGLEVTRKAFYLGGKPEQQAIIEGFRAFMKFWGDYEPPLDNYGNPHQKDIINTGDAFIDYFREYPLGEDPISPYIMAGDIPAIEFTFAIPLPISHPETGDPILYGGRLDMLGYYNNVVAVIDEKTSKSIQSTYGQTAKMRGQFLGYVWAARHYGVPARMVVVRLIAIQKTQTRHMPFYIEIEDYMIERWCANMLTKVRCMVEDYKAGAWDMSFGDACSSYGGCQFLDLCTSRSPEAWYDTFQRRVWNPLWRNPTEAPRDVK